MSLLLRDIITDQYTSASSYIKAHAPSLCNSMKAKCAWDILRRYLTKYWIWIVCMLVLRKVCKMLFRSKSKNNKKIRSKKNHRITSVGMEEENDRASSESVDNASTFDRNSYFAPSVNSAPSTASQMILSDDVIVVNKDNRYVEVYERRPTNADKYDRKVAALLKEFRPRKYSSD